MAITNVWRFGLGSGIGDHEQVSDDNGGDKTVATFNRGSHNVSTDGRYCDTADVADSVKASTQRLTLVFLQSVNDTRSRRFATLSALSEPGLVVRSAEAERVVVARHSAVSGVGAAAR